MMPVGPQPFDAPVSEHRIGNSASTIAMGVLENLIGPASPERRRAVEEKMIVGVFSVAMGGLVYLMTSLLLFPSAYVWGSALLTAVIAYLFVTLALFVDDTPKGRERAKRYRYLE